MNFWLNFNVLLDLFSQSWTLSGSKPHYPLSRGSTTLSELWKLPIDEIKRLRKFDDAQFANYVRVYWLYSLTQTWAWLVSYSTSPSKSVSFKWNNTKFINEEVDRFSESGYVLWSNSEWACPPVIAPKANGGLRFCINYGFINQKTIKPAYPLRNMRSISERIAWVEKDFLWPSRCTFDVPAINGPSEKEIPEIDFGWEIIERIV